jgi:hypothetical protein
LKKVKNEYLKKKNNIVLKTLNKRRKNEEPKVMVAMPRKIKEIKKMKKQQILGNENEEFVENVFIRKKIEKIMK